MNVDQRSRTTSCGPPSGDLDLGGLRKKHPTFFWKDCALSKVSDSKILRTDFHINSM